MVRARRAAFAKTLTYRPEVRTASLSRLLDESFVPLQLFRGREALAGLFRKTGKITGDRHVLRNAAILFSCDVCRRNVNKLCVEYPNQIDKMLRAVDVGLEGFIHG